MQAFERENKDDTEAVTILHGNITARSTYIKGKLNTNTDTQYV